MERDVEGGEMVRVVVGNPGMCFVLLGEVL